MPTITLSNGDRAELSLSEFVEYRRMLENIVPTIPAHDKPIVVAEKPVAPKPIVNSVPAPDGMHALKCGHLVPKKRGAGRYPACQECQNSNSAPVDDKPVEKAEKVAEKPSGGSKRGGKREFSQEQYDKWLAAHGDEEMSAKWEKRIRWMITDGYEMSVDQKQEFLGFLTQEPRLTFAEAHEFRTDIVRNFTKVAR